MARAVFALAVLCSPAFSSDWRRPCGFRRAKWNRSCRSGARTVTGGSRRLHSGFVVSEIALAVVLLVSAGMLGRTLLRLSSVDPGLNIQNVQVTRTALSPNILAHPAQIRVAWQELLDRVRSVPGVQSVAAVDTVPMRQGNNRIGYWTTAAVPEKHRCPSPSPKCDVGISEGDGHPAARRPVLQRERSSG